jgi:glycosyltransferase involved in cell wall biosynthesis
MAKFVFFDDKIINVLLQEEKPSGGAAVQAYGWIRGLKEIEQEVCVLTSKYKDGILKEECSSLCIIPLYDKNKGIRWLRWVYYRLPFLYKKIRSARPDYLYQGVPGWTSFFIGSMCQVLRIKYIVRISNDYLLDERLYHNYSRAHGFFQGLGFKLSYCILCQNEYQLSIIKKRFPNNRSTKILNPVLFKTVETPASLADRHYIAWIGLYQYQKNLKLLYEIASAIKEEVFFIAGKESSKCDEETALYLEKLSKLPNVHFTGFLTRDQILPFLSKAKFLLNTSHYEGFSNTFLEAMSAGTPIVTGEKVNPDLIISKYKLGLVYRNVPDLREQLSSVTADTYKELAENVLNYVVSNHNHKALAKRLVTYLEEVN